MLEIVQALIAFSLFAALLLLIVAATVYRDVDLGHMAWGAGAVLLVGLTALHWMPARYLAVPVRSMDVGATVERLEHLMRVDNVYTNEAPKSSGLAERVGIAPHQLSELINTRVQKGISRYLREHGVRAAQNMLIDARRCCSRF